MGQRLKPPLAVTLAAGPWAIAAGTATVRMDGQLNAAFTGTPSGPGQLTMTVADGVIRAPGNLTGIADLPTPYDLGRSRPHGRHYRRQQRNACRHRHHSGRRQRQRVFREPFRSRSHHGRPCRWSGEATCKPFRNRLRIRPCESAPTVTITGTNKELCGHRHHQPKRYPQRRLQCLHGKYKRRRALEHRYADQPGRGHQAGGRPERSHGFVASTNAGTTVNAVNSAGTDLPCGQSPGTSACSSQPHLVRGRVHLFVGHNNGLRALNTADGSQLPELTQVERSTQANRLSPTMDRPSTWIGRRRPPCRQHGRRFREMAPDTEPDAESAAVVDAAGNAYVTSTNRTASMFQDNGGSATQLWVNNSSFGRRHLRLQ